MSDFTTPETDAQEQVTPPTDEDEAPTVIDLVQEQGMPMDANEADALEQAHIEERNEDDYRTV